jgi:hypothetical protein
MEVTGNRAQINAASPTPPST